MLCLFVIEHHILYTLMRQMDSHALLQAILQTAIEDFRSGDRYVVSGRECGCPHGGCKRCPRPREFEIVPAWRWIAEASLEPWGFGWVCWSLGLDPDVVTEKLCGKGEVAWVNSMARRSGSPAWITAAVRAGL